MNQADVFLLIKELTGQGNILTIPRLFIEITGDVNSALLLSQLIYWQDKKNGEWVYKSYKEWTAEIGLSEKVVRRASKNLQEKGLIETKLKRANGSPTLHYKLTDNFVDVLIELTQKSAPICPFVGIHSDQTAETLTEITTEIIGTHIIPPAELVYEDIDKIPKKKENIQPLYPIALAISEVTGTSLELMKGRIMAEAKILAKDKRVSPELIRVVFGAPAGLWYRKDWRGKLGEKPKIADIRENIFRYSEVPTAKVIKGNIKTRNDGN